MTITETIARAMLTVDYADSEKTHPGITAEALDDSDTLEGYLTQAKAALTALAEAGFTVVPVAPSEDMRSEGADRLLGSSVDDWGDEAENIYRAMIEAGRVK